MQSESVEVLWALLRPHRLPRGFHQLIVGVVYHPPGEDNDRMISYIRNSLESFESSFPNSAIIIAGDFNKLKLKQTAKLFQLKSMVNFPTRGTNTLDQIFSNLSKYYNPPSSAPPFGLSDHVTIKVIPKDRVDSCKSQPKVIKVRDKRQSKKASLGRFLMEVPWSRMLSNELTCDQNIEIMTDIINYGLNTIMPQRSLRVHYNERPWMTSNLKTLISRRQKAFASGNSVLFKVLRNKVNRERKSIRKTYYKSKVENLRNVKPSKWWQEVKHLCGNHKTNARNLKDILSTELDYDEEVLCEKINESFISVMHDYSPLSPDVYVSMDMNEKFIEVEEIEVVKKLRKISCSKAGGPDGLPNWILKDYADILAQPITLILNVSFQNSQVPKLWKIADVVPLPKASTIKEFTRDLRPISLTSSLSKIVEEFVIEKDLKPVLLRFVDQNQYGFIPRSSTTHALISMIHHWLQMTDGKAVAVRAAFLDFKKAFDMIDHNVLIAKLLSLGVKSSTINWLIDFLRDRQQRIKLNNQCFSGWKSVPAGVPQGTCLGPWLFLAMINDLGSSGKTDSLMWKFADDTTTSELILQDQESHLQQEINHIARWSMENKLILNPKKCKEMTVCFRKTIPTFKAIEVDNQSFERVQKIKILGLTMRNDLKWNDHINDITKKAAKRLYFIKQLKRADVGTKDLVCYYCAIIRSILEYSCQVFHSGLPKYLSDELERVQKRAMGIIFPGIKYDDALAKANIPTLFDRRESLCRKFFNEIVNDKDHKLANLLPERTNGINNQLRTNRTFHTIKCYTNRFKNSFMLNYSNRHIS